MSKAFVRLNDNMSLDNTNLSTALSTVNSSTVNSSTVNSSTVNSSSFKKYLLLALIVGTLITIFACWWRYTENDNQESFNSDYHNQESFNSDYHNQESFDPDYHNQESFNSDYHNQEFFNPDYPGHTDSFPARVESNATINRTGRCNASFGPGYKYRRSILRKGRKIGYVRPYDQNEIEKERDRQNRRVTWSDPLIEIMGT